MEFIFGGNTGLTAEELARKRIIADGLRQRSVSNTPRNAGEGISAIGQAIASKYLDKKIEPQEKQERSRIADLLAGFSSFGSAPLSSRAGATQSGISQTTLPPANDLPQSINDAVYGDNASRVREGLVARGLPEHIADGFVMNFQDESNLDPGINEQNPLVAGSRGGFGLAQWTGPRRRELEAFAAQSGRPLNDIDTQLDFLMSELSGSESAAAREIMGAGDAGSAAQAIVNKFLRPAEEHRTRRASKYGGSQPQQASQVPMGALMEVANNPLASDAQKSIAQMMIQRQMQPADPLADLKRRKLEAEISNLNVRNDGQSEFGLTPQFITDQDGNLKMMQLSKSGQTKLVDIPEGAEIAKGVEKIDLGNEFQWVNKFTGEMIGEPIKKNLAAAESAKATGKARAEAEIDLPRVISNAEQTMTVIDEALAHPGLSGSVGLIEGRLPATTEARADFMAYHKQITGKTFLEAYNTLKGGGQITEVEGAKAEAAIARLDRVQSEEGYRKALKDLQDVIQAGVDRAKGAAGQQPIPTLAQPKGVEEMSPDEFEAWLATQ